MLVEEAPLPTQQPLVLQVRLPIHPERKKKFRMIHINAFILLNNNEKLLGSLGLQHIYISY